MPLIFPSIRPRDAGLSPENARTLKPEWWTDEGLKALSLRVVAALPHEYLAHTLRGNVLAGKPPTNVHSSDVRQRRRR